MLSPKMSKQSENAGGTANKSKIGEIFQDEDGKQTINCVHCSQDFKCFPQFTLHIQDHYLRDEISPLKRKIDFEEVLIKVESNNSDNEENTERYDYDIDIGLHSPVDETMKYTGNFVVPSTKDTKLFQCDICKDQFQDRTNLNNHFELIHTLVPPDNSMFECSICGEKFKVYRNFRIHINNHKSDTTKRLSSFNFKAGTTPVEKTWAASTERGEITNELLHHAQKKCTLLQCKICGKSFKTYRDFQMHINSHEGDYLDHVYAAPPPENLEMFETNEQTETEKLTCDICGWKSKKKKYLVEHRKTHFDNRVPCKICGKKVTANNLREHIKIHTNAATFLCNVCGRRFIKKERLTQHLIVHSTESKHECHICSIKYNRTDKLLLHYRKEHSDALKFYCKTCNVGFMDKKSMVRHENIHLTKAVDEIKSEFYCTTCNTSFKNKRQMYEHKKSTHPT